MCGNRHLFHNTHVPYNIVNWHLSWSNTLWGISFIEQSDCFDWLFWFNGQLRNYVKVTWLIEKCENSEPAGARITLFDNTQKSHPSRWTFALTFPVLVTISQNNGKLYCCFIPKFQFCDLRILKPAIVFHTIKLTAVNEMCEKNCGDFNHSKTKIWWKNRNNDYKSKQFLQTILSHRLTEIFSPCNKMKLILSLLSYY